MAHNWAAMSDETLISTCKDGAKMDLESDTEKEKAQLELCKRFKWRCTRADGSLLYEPPDWKG